MKQSTNKILMVEPVSFMYNEQTALSNEFQHKPTIDAKSIADKAIEEHRTMVQILRSKGIEVEVIQDTPEPPKPDAIFPNNWLMMHQDGSILIFPMKNENRQREIRMDVVEELQRKYRVDRVLDYSSYHQRGIAMEGTGSVVFNHMSRTAYACLSPRTDLELLKKICSDIGYSPIVFHSTDSNGKDIYHTNVVMCVGSGYTVIGLDSIKNPDEKAELLKSFEENELEVIALSQEQLLQNFAGNMLEVCSLDGIKYLVMSKRAFDSLDGAQKSILQKYVQLLPIPLDVIETVGGGSARCMMAENFLESIVGEINC